MGGDGEEPEAVMTSSFTRAEKDYYILICRSMTDHDRALVSLVLEALARAARSEGQGWSADELVELARMTRGEVA
jgi:hypothetical protein